jgi:hypothetical protein
VVHQTISFEMNPIYDFKNGAFGLVLNVVSFGAGNPATVVDVFGMTYSHFRVPKKKNQKIMILKKENIHELLNSSNYSAMPEPQILYY